MTEAEKDTHRATAAARRIFDGRDPVEDMGAIMCTLEHLVSAVLLITMDGNHSKAIDVLNLGLAPGVKQRLARNASKSN